MSVSEETGYIIWYIYFLIIKHQTKLSSCFMISSQMFKH